MSIIIKYTLLISGYISLALGIIGIFIPILPTTPFLLLAGVCFAHSAPKMYDRLINTRYIGKIIKDYREGKGMPASAVAVSITFLWIMILLSVFFATDTLWVKLLLISIAIAVSIHIYMLRNKN